LDGAWTVLDDHGEVAQALVFRKGALISVDGERATRALRRGFAQSGFATEPVVIEPVDDEPPYLSPRRRADVHARATRQGAVGRARVRG
ncbi:MAG: hypothetical protein KC464_28675, partial [Myxococcales bacterium]|nr:hypothetical protein [Myxococcales bacterium]